MTIALATICMWRSSPLAPIIIANLCAGDGKTMCLICYFQCKTLKLEVNGLFVFLGFADLIGRRFGGAKLPYNENKSYIGSLAMLIFGFIFCVGYLNSNHLHSNP